MVVRGCERQWWLIRVTGSGFGAAGGSLRKGKKGWSSVVVTASKGGGRWWRLLTKMDRLCMWVSGGRSVTRKVPGGF